MGTWDPGFQPKLGKLSKLGKLAKIMKVLTNKENSSKKLGKLEVRPKNKVLTLIFVGKLGKFSQLRKVPLED